MLPNRTSIFAAAFFALQAFTPVAYAGLSEPVNGAVGMIGATFNATAASGAASLTAERVGGTSGALTVTYTTISESAVAGKQFTASTGTIQWANGDGANKTFTIPLSKTAFTGTKSFAIRLKAGADTMLGAHTSATVVISGSAATTTTPMPAVTLSATPTTVTTGSTATLKWNATNAQTCAASGGWTATGLAASGSQAVPNLTKNTTFTVNCTNTTGSAAKSTVVLVQTATTTPPPTTTSTGAVARPSYNTGDGFFVLNGKLYDPDGYEFRIRGVDRAHYDSDSAAGIAKSGANAVRAFLTTEYGQTWPGLEAIMQNDHVNNQEMPIPTFAGNATATSCSTDNSLLSLAVSTWVSNASIWKALNRYMMINIANEWGPGNSTVWRDQYISAVQQLRAAGYTAPLMIDTGTCGQDMQDLLNYSAAIFNADPQKNIVFSFHLYGNTATAAMAPFFAQLNALQQSQGMVFVVGEFGPGRNIGPSPTLTTPGQVITAAEANNLGWIAWAWDDNDLGSCKSDDNWFSMTYSCGVYAQPSDLTIFGKDVVLNATYGLQALAKKPNW